jgi:hypothetical protein
MFTVRSWVRGTFLSEVLMPRWDRRAFAGPKPNSTVSTVSTWINRAVMLPRQRVRLVLPAQAASRLAALRGKPVFLAPNHPEFLTDWAIDKELCDRAGLQTASWADQSIVNMHPLLQRFWLANNLVANVPGGGGEAYSVDWAAGGRAVLLHPEGRVGWRNNRVGSLLPGLARMAVETARQAGEAWVQPMVWKLVFTRDVRAELCRELGYVERRLGLSASTGALEERFGALLAGVQVQREHAFGRDLGPCSPQSVFERQEGLFQSLYAELCEAFGEPEGDMMLRVGRLGRSARRAGHGEKKAEELDRLLGLTRDVYGGLTLTQEQVAESLKRVRQQLLRGSRADRIAALMPRPVGSRVAHVEVPNPILVRGGADPVAVTRLARRSMQAALDGLQNRVYDRGARWTMRNPLVRPPVPWVRVLGAPVRACSGS